MPKSVKEFLFFISMMNKYSYFRKNFIVCTSEFPISTTIKTNVVDAQRQHQNPQSIANSNRYCPFKGVQRSHYHSSSFLQPTQSNSRISCSRSGTIVPSRLFSALKSDETPSSSTTTTTTTTTTATVIPRAAVSVVVRLNKDNGLPSYVLVQRGNEPNKGMWSLPGGKVEPGETSIFAAKRELLEETGLPNTTKTNNLKMIWSEDGPITITDAIVYNSNDDKSIKYHYVISQWFVSVQEQQIPPKLIFGDDAANAKWFTMKEIKNGIQQGNTTLGVEKVILRSELLYNKGIL